MSPLRSLWQAHSALRFPFLPRTYRSAFYPLCFALTPYMNLILDRDGRDARRKFNMNSILDQDGRDARRNLRLKFCLFGIRYR